MKKYIITAVVLIVIAIIFCLTGIAKADSPKNYSYNAWDNYYNHYGQYFDNFFNKPRVLYYAPNQAAHERTLRLMAAQGIPYHNHYTGTYNGVQTPVHIFNTSRTIKEYHYRMEIWKRYGNIVY
jgi:hypothetical protein